MTAAAEIIGKGIGEEEAAPFDSVRGEEEAAPLMKEEEDGDEKEETAAACKKRRRDFLSNPKIPFSIFISFPFLVLIIV